MGPLGWQETVFIFVLALLIFGPKKLPELGKTIGKAVTEFRRASRELKSTWDRELSSLEQEVEPFREAAGEVQGAIGTYDEYLDSLSCDTTGSDPLTETIETAGAADPYSDQTAAVQEETAPPEADTLAFAGQETEPPASGEFEPPAKAEELAESDTAAIEFAGDDAAAAKPAAG